MEWFSQYAVTPAPRSLKGDKIILPPTVLEQLLERAPHTQSSPTSVSASLDPYNPYLVAAQRHARTQLDSREKQLPYPLTFRLVNPENQRVVYAGIQEFSADEGHVGLSPFLLRSLGIKEPTSVMDVHVDAETVRFFLFSLHYQFPVSVRISDTHSHTLRNIQRQSKP